MFLNCGRRRGSELFGQGVLIDDTRAGWPLAEQGWDNKGLDGQPSPYIDSADWLCAIRERLVKSRHIVIRLGRVIPGRVDSHDGKTSHSLICECKVEPYGLVPRKWI